MLYLKIDSPPRPNQSGHLCSQFSSSQLKPAQSLLDASKHFLQSYQFRHPLQVLYLVYVVDLVERLSLRV